MKIIIESPFQLKYENETEILTELFKRGLKTYHLDKTFFTLKTMTDFVKSIPVIYHNRIILHSHHTLIRKFNFGGLHYSRKTTEPGIKNWWHRRITSAYMQSREKTISVVKMEDLKTESILNYNYVFYAPSFDSMHEKVKEAGYEKELKEVLKNSCTRVIARGEVDVRKLEWIKDLGFYGIALNRCIWETGNPIGEYEKIVRRCEELGYLES